ncbi:MAG TPA: hypothetical protein VN915_11480 [Elusimicrobiota bacterium]|nr:hypothetical protein [Elusimicrobiota bacterium]
MKNALALITAAVLSSVLAASLLGRALIAASSPTYDEPVHLSAGFTDLVDGRYRLNALDHPPLGEMWAALPLLTRRLDRFSAHPAWLEGQVYHFGDLFLYHNRVGPRELLDPARTWSLVTLTLLVALALVPWAWRLEGPAAGWGAAAALSFCVPWFSNAALVTTDASSSALFFAACSILAGPRRSAGAWALAGAATGAALAAKFNMVLLLPLIGFALLAESRAEKSRRPRARDIILALTVSALVLAAVYRFSFVSLWFDGLAATFSRLSSGRAAYLHGSWSSEGWWWYFPAAFLLKTPLALLLLGGLGAYAALRRPRAEAAWLLIPPAGYFVAALTSKTDIGYRHLLPVYPFVCLWAGLGAARLWKRGRPARAALGVLGLWLAVSVVSNAPHSLAYFNELAGGRGERWLSDSNLDWGQDLPALARELAARGNPPVLLSYFGAGDPEAYGIKYVPLGFITNVERTGNAALAPGAPVFFAISETNLTGTYFKNHALFDWLRSRRPAAVPGGSIALYDLTDDAEGRVILGTMLAGEGRAGDARVALVHSK